MVDRQGRLIEAAGRRAAGATLSVDALVPFGHWITPPGGTRRYDTRFFLAVAPPDQVASPDGHEAVAAGWHRPADLLDAATAGEITLILPTQRSLEAIVDARTVADIVAGAAA